MDARRVLVLTGRMVVPEEREPCHPDTAHGVSCDPAAAPTTLPGCKFCTDVAHRPTFSLYSVLN
eukprot:1223268-Rhodomonas_salina.4